MIARRIRMGLALLLGSAAAFVGMSALTSSPAMAVGPKVICSASDSNSSTGRQYATVEQADRPPHTCIRTKLGSEAPNFVPDCWAAATNAGLDCSAGIIG